MTTRSDDHPTLPATLRAAERQAMQALTEWVRQHFGGRVRDLRLFGSRARGEGHDSDLDVLVVVERLTGDEWREIAYHGGDLLTERGVMVAPLALSLEQWDTLRRRGRLIATEIQCDGIPL